MKKYVSDEFEGTNASLSGALTLSGFPNTRNDGQIPTNKTLSTDSSGNMRLYSIAIAPAPYLEILIPDSTLPSTTTNFTLKGAFFTPTMTVSIPGQTVNYVTFKSDNLVLVNVTTGATEGMYAVTLNNGISATFNNALLIILGTVFIPKSTDYLDVAQPIDLSVDGEVLVSQYGVTGSAKLDDTKIGVRATGNFQFRFSYDITPFNSTPDSSFVNTSIDFYRVSDNVKVYSIGLFLSSSGYAQTQVLSGNTLATTDYFDSGSVGTSLWKNPFKLQRVGGVLTLYQNDVLKSTIAFVENSKMYVKFVVTKTDIVNVKYIEIA